MKRELQNNIIYLLNYNEDTKYNFYAKYYNRIDNTIYNYENNENQRNNDKCEK